MFFRKKVRKFLGSDREINPEDIFLDAHYLDMGQDQVLEKPLKKTFIFWLFIAFGILVLFSLGFVFNLQILQHKKFTLLAQRNRYFSVSLSSQRGVIYDRNFHQLTENVLQESLICQKDKIESFDYRERIYKNLAEVLGKRWEEVKEIIEGSKNNEVILKENIDYKTTILIEGMPEEFYGCEVKYYTRRDYKDGPIFSHIIGYYREKSPAYGLEDYYNEVLKPKEGKIVRERDAKGNIISEHIVQFPKPGNSLVLYLDKDLQEKLYYTLKDKMKEFGVKKGVAVAMDPNTGGILSMVSIPSFDNNLFSKGITQKEWEKLINDPNHPLLNRVIGGRYPTGSTIKPFIAAAALQEGIINENTKINCKGEIVVDNPWFPDKPWVFQDWMVHGVTDVKKAIAQSCNVFFYTVGGGYKNFKGLGVERIKKYLQLFGWGGKLNIDLGGEVSGFIPDPQWKKERFNPPENIWYPGDTYNLSIGQGYILIPPLEVVTAFSAIANGGILYKPQLVKAIVDENHNVVEEFKPEIIRQGFINPKYLEIVREGMRGAVTYGSATILNDLPVKAAAKTGTAQTGKEGYYHNWITVFAPYDNPQIVLTVMVEDVPGLHVIVGDVAREVLKWYFQEENKKEE